MSCPRSAPAQQTPRSQGGGSWRCRGCRRGGGDTQSRSSSRASCDRPSRVQTPGPYPTPGQESREEPAHPKTGAKVRRKLPLTSPGSYPWSRPWGSWTHPQLPIGAAGVGHKDTCPRDRAWPGLLPLQRVVCRPGPASGRRARGPREHRGWGSSPSRPPCSLLTTGPTLLRGGPERALSVVSRWARSRPPPDPARSRASYHAHMAMPWLPTPPPVDKTARNSLEVERAEPSR